MKTVLLKFTTLTSTPKSNQVALFQFVLFSEVQVYDCSSIIKLS